MCVRDRGLDSRWRRGTSGDFERGSPGRRYRCSETDRKVGGPTWDRGSRRRELDGSTTNRVYQSLHVPKNGGFLPISTLFFLDKNPQLTVG